VGVVDCDVREWLEAVMGRAERFKAEDLAKLPKWAQSTIRALESDVEHYRREAIEVRDGDTNVWTWDAEGYRPLPKGARVSFTIPGGVTSHHDERFDVRVEGDVLVVSAGDGISVRPISSNVVRVTILDREERTR
jgi:hypothetical protein